MMVFKANKKALYTLVSRYAAVPAMKEAEFTTDKHGYVCTLKWQKRERTHLASLSYFDGICSLTLRVFDQTHSEERQDVSIDLFRPSMEDLQACALLVHETERTDYHEKQC